jgi:molybdopterin biosynthesis enzyme
MSTGNEVYEADYEEKLPLGGIRDANRPSLKAALESAGISVVDLGIVADS